MVAIKDMEMPKSCGECNCSGTGVCKEWVYLNGYDLGKKRADTCPLVETEEHKTGKWTGEEEGYYSECSCCGASFLWEDYKYLGDWKYCPKCGAKLDRCENG